MNEHNLKTLWGNIPKVDTTFKASYESFKSVMQNEDNRKTIYNRLRDLDKNTKATDEDFDKMLGFAAKPAQTDTPTSTISQEPLQLDTTQRNDATLISGLPSESAYASLEEVSNQEPESRRQEKYKSWTDTELNNSYQSMLAQAEKKKTEAMDKAQKGYQQFEEEHPFLSAAKAVGNPTMLSQYAAPPQQVSVIESQNVEDYVDNKEEFLALKKELGVRQFESGYNNAYDNTVLSESLVKNARSKKDLTAQDKRYLKSAEYLNEKARELLNAPSMYDGTSGFENWAEGLSNDLLDRDIIAGVGLVRDKRVDDIVQKLNNGEELTESEAALFNASFNLHDVRYARSFDLPLGYKIGQGTAQSVPFMIDMMITRGLGGAGKKMLIQSLKKFGVAASKIDDVGRWLGGAKGVAINTKEGRKVYGALSEGTKKTAKDYTRDVLEEVVGTPLQTAIMPSARRQMLQEKTNLRYETKENDIAFKDRARIFTNAAVQTFTERAGGKVIDWALGKVLPLNRIFGGYNKGLLSTFNDIVQSPVGEVGEEYLGATINLIRGIDMFNIYSDESNQQLQDEAKEMFTDEGFWTTVGTILPMSLLGGAVNFGSVRSATNKYNRSHLELSKYLQNTGATQEQAERILSQLEGVASTQEFQERLGIVENHIKNHILNEETDLALAEEKVNNLNTLLKSYVSSVSVYNEAVKDLTNQYMSLSKEQKELADKEFADISRKVKEAGDISASSKDKGKDVTPAKKEAAWTRKGLSITLNGKKTKASYQGVVYTNEDGSIDTQRTDMSKFRILNDKGQNVRTTVRGQEKKDQIFNEYLDAINNKLRMDKAKQEEEVRKKEKEALAIEEAIKAERKKKEEQARLELERKNAAIQAEKDAIAAKQADRETIKASFPKDKNGEDDIDRMTPEQFFVYESELDGEENAVATVNEELESLYQQLKENAGIKANAEKRQRNAAKIKRRIRQYEDVIVKYFGQETLDKITAARNANPPAEGGGAAQGTAPVVGGEGTTIEGETPPVEKPKKKTKTETSKVETSKVETPEGEIPKVETPQAETPQAETLGGATQKVEAPEAEEVRPIDLSSSEYAVLQHSTDTGKKAFAIARVIKSEEGNVSYVDPFTNEPIDSNYYHPVAKRYLGIKQGKTIVPVLALSLRDNESLNRARDKVKYIPVVTTSTTQKRAHITDLLKQDEKEFTYEEGKPWKALNNSSRVQKQSESASIKNLDDVLNMDVLGHTEKEFTLRDLLECPTEDMLKTKLRSLGLSLEEVSMSKIKAKVLDALNAWRAVIRENKELNEKFKKAETLKLDYYNKFRDIINNNRDRTLFVQSQNTNLFKSDPKNPLVQLAILADVASQIGLVTPKESGRYTDTLQKYDILGREKKARKKAETKKADKSAKKRAAAINVDEQYDKILGLAETYHDKDESVRTKTRDAIKQVIKDMTTEESIALYDKLVAKRAEENASNELKQKIDNAIHALENSSHANSVKNHKEGKEAKQSPKVPKAKKATTTSAEKPSDANAAKRAALIQQLEDAEDMGDNVQAQRLREEIDALDAELKAQYNQFSINDTVVTNEKAGKFIVDLLRKVGLDVEYATREQIESMYGAERYRELRNKGKEIFGWRPKGTNKIYINADAVNPNTAIHEYTHIWWEMFTHENKEAAKKAITLLKKTKAWKQIKEKEGYKGRLKTDSEIASEVLAFLSGEKYGAIAKGDKTLLETLSNELQSRQTLRAITKLIKDFWDWVLEKIGFPKQELTDVEQIVQLIQKPIYELVWKAQNNETFDLTTRNEDTEALNAKQLKQGNQIADSSIEMQISKSTLQDVDRWLGQREDLSKVERDSFLNYIFYKEPVVQRAMAKWFGNGAIRIPNDLSLVEQAVKYAKKMKADMVKYDRPAAIVKEYHDRFGISLETVEEDREYLSPDDSRFNGILTNKVDYGNGITVYNVQDDIDGQRAVRELMNDHLGKDFNCWCLLYANANGELSETAIRYWNQYESIPKRVAFDNGRICSFCASHNGYTEWWDLHDKSHGEYIPATIQIPNDELGRYGMVDFHEKTGIFTESDAEDRILFRGNKKNGLYEEWHEGEGRVVRSNYKRGKFDGITEEFVDGKLWAREEWKKGERHGETKFWDENGALVAKTTWENGFWVKGETYDDAGDVVTSRDATGSNIVERKYSNGVLLEEDILEKSRNGISYEEGVLLERKVFSPKGNIVSSIKYPSANVILRTDFYLNGEIKFTEDTEIGDSHHTKTIRSYDEDGNITKYIYEVHEGIASRKNEPTPMSISVDYIEGVTIVNKIEYYNLGDVKMEEEISYIIKDGKLTGVDYGGPVISINEGVTTYTIEYIEDGIGTIEVREGNGSTDAVLNYLNGTERRLNNEEFNEWAKNEWLVHRDGVSIIETLDAMRADLKAIQKEAESIIGNPSPTLSPEALGLEIEEYIDEEDDVDFFIGNAAASVAPQQSDNPMDMDESVEFHVANTSQEIFVSNAEMAIRMTMQNKAKPQQWISMLSNKGGIKKGEDAWLGLTDWLNAQGDRTVTKQEILDFIAENKIIIEEKRYTEGTMEDMFAFANTEEGEALIESEMRLIAEEQAEREIEMEDYETEEEYYDAYDEYIDELLDPSSNMGYSEMRALARERAFVEANKTGMINEIRLRYTTEGLEHKKEIALTVPTIEPWKTHDEVHFGDAGDGRAIAWIRFGDTVDENGNSVLVIDEIQSNRHQEGAKKGYVSSDVTRMKEEYDELDYKQETGSITEEEGNRLVELEGTLAEIDPAGELENSVPDAPFDKNWHELAFKRMLRYAAENGYDYVAWTTGMQQAERYLLGRSVKEIYSRTHDNGRKSLFLDFDSGRRHELLYNPNTHIIEEGELGPNDVAGQTLEEAIGRGLAKKAIELEDDKVEGVEGVMIGGEGMQAFYDQKIPNFVRKYTRNWGAEVQDIYLPELEESAQTMHAVNVTPQMKESVMEGQLEFMIGPSANRETLDKIEKASKNVTTVFRKTDTPIPEKTDKVIDFAIKSWDSGAAIRDFMKKLRIFRRNNGLGNLPQGRDVRQIYDNQRVVLRNKVMDLFNLYETPLRDALKELVEYVAKSDIYQKYRVEKIPSSRKEDVEVVQPDGSVVIEEKYAESILTPEEFVERYLIACDNIERVKMGKPSAGLQEFYQRMGVTVHEFQVEFENAIGASKEGESMIKSLIKRIKDFNDYVTEQNYQSGMLTPEEYNERMARQHYVPERDFAMEKDEEAMDVNRTHAYRSRKLSSSMRAKGRTSLASNVIANLINIGYIDLQKSNMNAPKLAMFRVMMENEGFRKAMNLPTPEEVWYDKDGNRTTNKPDRETKNRMRWLENEIFKMEEMFEEEIEKPEEERDEAEIAYITGEIDNLKEELASIPFMTEYDTRRMYQGENNPNMVSVYVDGMPCTMQFPNMTGITKALNNDWGDDVRFVNGFRAISGYVGSVLTTYEPTFFVRNTSTDSIAILTKGFVELGPLFSLKYIATIKDAKPTMNIITSYLRGKDYRDMEDGELFHDFLMRGGNTGYATIRKMETLLKEIEAINPDTPSVDLSAASIKKALSFTNEASELWLRFSAYKVAIDMGLGIDKAIWAANNLSANFNRGGKGTDTKYGRFMEFFRSLSLFSNPAIQGALSYWRMFGDEGDLDTKQKVAKWSRLVLAAGFMPAFAGFLNAMMFDDDEQEEWNVSDYDRANYLVLGKYGKFPVAHMLRPFYNIGVNSALQLQGRRNSGEVAGSIISSFLLHLTPAPPVLTEAASGVVNTISGAQQLSLFDFMRNMMTNQAMGTLNDLASGTNYLGEKIKYDDGETAQWTKNPNAGPVERQIAYYLYRLAGGLENGITTTPENKNKFKDALNLTPNEVKSFSSMILPRSVLNVANVGYGAYLDIKDIKAGEYTESNIPLQSIPLAGDFLRDRNEKGYRTGIYLEANAIHKEYQDRIGALNTELERISTLLNNETDNEKRVKLGEHYDKLEKHLQEVSSNPVYQSIATLLPEYKQHRTTSLFKEANMLNEKEFKKNFPDVDLDIVEEGEKNIIFNLSQLVQMERGPEKVNEKIPYWMKGIFNIKDLPESDADYTWELMKEWRKEYDVE